MMPIHFNKAFAFKTSFSAAGEETVRHRNLRHKPYQIQVIEQYGERLYLMYTEDASN